MGSHAALGFLSVAKEKKRRNEDRRRCARASDGRFERESERFETTRRALSAKL